MPSSESTAADSIAPRDLRLASTPSLEYDAHMKIFEARVVRGRLTLDAPSALPEGTLVPLMVADDGELDDEDRAALRAALSRARADFRAGRVHTVQQIIKGRQRVAR